MERAISHIYKRLEKCGGEIEVANVSLMVNISKEAQNNTFNGITSRKIFENYDKYMSTLPINLKPLAENLNWI